MAAEVVWDVHIPEVFLHKGRSGSLTVVGFDSALMTSWKSTHFHAALSNHFLDNTPFICLISLWLWDWECHDVCAFVV